MKKFLFIVGFGIALCITSSVYAVEETITNTPIPIKIEDRRAAIEVRATQKMEKRIENTTNITSRLKEKAIKELDRRIASLTKLIEKITVIKRLTEVQKSTLFAQVQEEITSLTTLKTTITGQTDIEALRSSIQSIVRSYRIYVLYIPKMNIIANGDKILSLIEGEMTTLTTKLQMRIDEVKAKGISVDAINGLMTQRQAKLTEATTQARGAIKKVVVLTPDGWPGNRTELQSARAMLEIARKAMNDAQKLAGQIRDLLKGVKSIETPKPTSSE